VSSFGFWHQRCSFSQAVVEQVAMAVAKLGSVEAFAEPSIEASTVEPSIVASIAGPSSIEDTAATSIAEASASAGT